MNKKSPIDFMPHTIIGIDPGINGAIAAVRGNELLFAVKTPLKRRNKSNNISNRGVYDYDYAQMKELLMRCKDSKPVAYLERVHSMPKQGVAAMFTFGRGYGIWIGMLEALEIPIIYVTPKKWKRKMIPGKDKGKEQSVIQAKKFFPEIDLLPGRMIKPHDGIAEAALIAVYGGLELWQ